MNGKYSRKAFLEFLDYLAQKGLVTSNTIHSRKAAVNKVFGILADDEAEDVTKLDIDDVMTRFTNLQGKGYTPDSLATYRSRVKTALDDFVSYVANPLAFKPSVQLRDRKPPTGTTANAAKGGKDRKSDRPSQVSQPTPAIVSVGPMSSSILPVPIRANLTVMIQGLPYDLTAAEAKKIAAVVQAMALEK